MKKTMMAAVVASALLATAGANAAGFNGAYVGVDVGFTKATIEDLPFIGDLEGDQTNFGIKLGYGSVLSGAFYLGGEIGFRNSAGDFGSKTIVGDGESATISAKTSNAKMISLIPGFVVSPSTLVYGRIGRGDTDVEFKASNTLGQSESASSNESFNIYGAGLSYLVNQNVSANFEFNKITADDADATSLNLGVNYRF